MIILIVCDYCGNSKSSTPNKVIEFRCKHCGSKIRVKKYDPIDTYVGCPAFENSLPEPDNKPHEYGSYGDMYGEYYD